MFGQSSNQNYIQITRYKVPTANGFILPNGNAVNDQDKEIVTSYYDGIGRLIQINNYLSSSTGKNTITHIKYDHYGRLDKDNLEFTIQGNQDFIAEESANTYLTNYYLTTSSGASALTNYPFSSRKYDGSPINRLKELAGPGEDWQIENSDKHTIRFGYQTNVIDEVKMYMAQSTWNPTTKLYNCALTQPQFYPAGTLYKTVTKDENHSAQDQDLNTVAEFKDKEGRVILKRTYNFNEASNQVESLDTYYVYDQFGMLSFVLPPLCDLPTKLNDLGYQYRYDHRNRLVEKKLPGKLWEFICYDKLDRVVAAGPVIHPENPNSSAVIYTKYDAFNRVILTAYAALTTQTRLSIQNFYDTATALNETKSATTITLGGVATRYTNTVNPTVSYRPLTINYYDDYDFPSANTVFSTMLGVPVFYNNTTQKPKGMPTGNWARVFNGTSTVVTQLSTHFYDAKARLIKTHKRNHISGGYTVTETEFDFSGKVLQKRTAHRYNSTSNELVVRERFIYSSQDRLLRHEHQVNGTNWEILANNSYDELGQLISKKVGKQDPTGASFLQKVDYAYNIRGWLTAINNVANTTDIVTDLFAFKINYNNKEQNIPGVTNLYNGNISETYWRTESDGFTRMYGYQYDDLNRLLKGNYRKLGYSVTGNYDESLSYDKHGNIQTLQRNGFADADFGMSVQIDNLAYTYIGNQLQRVTDSSNSLNGFRDGTNTGTDFGYDNYGNMNRDNNKQLSISYNHLNLPVAVEFVNSNRILYHYNALGEKLLKSVRTNNPSSEVVTEYIDGFQYKGGVLKFFPTAEGYVEFLDPTKFFYVYNYTDHLGNVRLSYTQNGNTVKTLEDNHYYPFGLKHENYASERFERIRQENGDLYVIQPTERREWQYKYNGKEWQDELGQNVYAFGWRDYDPAIGRFTKSDRFAEKYHKLTPYGYAGNNPVLVNDIQGDSLWISFGRNNQNRVLYQNGQLQNKDGSRYEGAGVRVKKDGSIKITDSFLSSVVSALSNISNAEGEAGTNVISTLQGSENNFTIAEGWNHFDPGEMNKPGIYMNDATYVQGINIGRGQIGGTSPSSIVGSGGIIYWNPAGQSTYITRNGEMPVNNTLALGHEMFHAFDANSGNLVRMHYNGTEVGEIRASYFENRLRQTNTFNHNTNYRSQYNDGGYNLLNTGGQPRTVPPTILWNN